jgi:glutathione S-transferase
MCGYLFFGEELSLPLEEYPNILKWLDRIRALPGWKHPYDLVPRGPAA